MSKKPWLPVALVVIALTSAGCSSESATASRPSTSGSVSSEYQKAEKFAACMRQNGVSQFPDPDASGQLTIDQIANGSSIETNSAAFTHALSACNALQPPGFTGTARTAEQQKAGLKFAQCIRDQGVKNFPDPDPNGPLINVDAPKFPGLDAAIRVCSRYATAAGVTGAHK